MTSRQILHDVGMCLRAAAPPLLALGMLALARTAQGEGPMPAGVDELVLVAWRAASIAGLLWFVGAATWAATRPRRDLIAFHRLHHLRGTAMAPDRALVHVQTSVWSSPAGQLVVVVNVETGVTSRVWLPEKTVPIGSFVVLERTNGGVSVVGALNANHVEAAHRYERQNPAQHITCGELGLDLPEREDALQLIEETERYLKEQDPRR